MKIILTQDKQTNLDLQESAKILNTVCKTIEFEAFDRPVILGSSSTHIDFQTERISLLEQLENKDVEHAFYSTKRKYENNFFFYSTVDSTILSFFGWQHYTNLPIENGLFFFIATILALEIDDSFRHEDTTGCIYDFLWDKTGVDVGMKTGHICQDCLKRIQDNVKASKSLSNVFSDLVSILEVLSNTSRWGRSVLSYKEQTDIGLNWSSFEDEVAQMYRELGAEVKQNVNLAGFQTDILIEETTASKQKLRSIVECKFYRNKIGNKVVNDFARVFHTVKHAGLVDKGIIVSYSGFTPDAYLASKETQVELVNFRDLKQAIIEKTGVHVAERVVKKHEKTTEAYVVEKEITTKQKAQKYPQLFVIMPFSPDLDDVYYLGIHEIAKELGCSCERVDEMEFVGGILDKIYDSIRNSRIVIAEVSTQSANVYYELGHAHALDKPTILLTKDISSAPFDVRGFNHIVYTSIRDLQNKLRSRLSAILGL